MVVDPELSALMLQSVTWQPRATLDGYAQPSFGAATTITPCRIEYENRMVRGQNGEEQSSSVTVYTDAIYGVQVPDVITLPNGESSPVVSVATHWDEEGASHEVLFL